MPWLTAYMKGSHVNSDYTHTQTHTQLTHNLLRSPLSRHICSRFSCWGLIRVIIGWVITESGDKLTLSSARRRSLKHSLRIHNSVKIQAFAYSLGLSTLFYPSHTVVQLRPSSLCYQIPPNTINTTKFLSRLPLASYINIFPANILRLVPLIHSVYNITFHSSHLPPLEQKNNQTTY